MDIHCAFFFFYYIFIMKRIIPKVEKKSLGNDQTYFLPFANLFFTR